MSELKDFLAKLAVHPEELGKFIHDPEKAMKEAELSNGDKSALLNELNQFESRSLRR